MLLFVNYEDVLSTKIDYFKRFLVKAVFFIYLFYFIIKE